MRLGVVLRCLCIASGVAVGTAAALARSRRVRRAIEAARIAGESRPCALKPAQRSAEPVRRDYFVITKMRGSCGPQKWVLQGFGRFECLLLFDSWREAMDQACFRTENLADAEFVPLASLR